MPRTLRGAIESGRFIVTGETGPPMSASAQAVVKKVGYFSDVDAVNTTDNQSGVVRMSSIATARLLLDHGLDPIVQMTCRDRNRIGLQSDILGAAGLGVANLLLLTGDHMVMGNQPDARPVFDIDSVQLIHVAHEMREGRFMNGDAIKTPPAKKVEAGADFIQTQGVFDVDRFARWMVGVRDLGLHERVKIIAGVLPTKSAKALNYMKENVAGMVIPDEFIARMKSAEEPAEEGVAIVCEIIARVREIEGVSGVHLMPVLWEKIIPRVVDEAGLKVDVDESGGGAPGDGSDPRRWIGPRRARRRVGPRRTRRRTGAAGRRDRWRESIGCVSSARLGSSSSTAP